MPDTFDVTKARADGYSDEDIARKLGRDVGYDADAAIRDGAKAADIIEHLKTRDGGARFYAEGTAQRPFSSPREIWNKVSDFAEHNPLTNFTAGVGAAAIGTGEGIYDLARRIPGADHVLPEISPYWKDAGTPPEGFFGDAGKVAERVLEYAYPLSKVARVTKALPLIWRLLSQGATAGTIAGLQEPGDMRTRAQNAGINAGITVATGGIGEAAPAVGKRIAVPIIQKVIDSSPRPLAAGAVALAQKYGVPLTRSMEGGSRTLQAAEKMLGHTVAPDLYEPMIEQAHEGLVTGATDLSDGFSTDRFGAGEKTLKTMLTKARDFEHDANQEYANLARLEADPANGGLPVDMRPTKQALAKFVDDYGRRMTPAQRSADPGLAAIKNILTRPDELPASVAEHDLSYLKEILRGPASPQAKRLAGAAIDAMEQQVRDAVSQAGPGALRSLDAARESWKARSFILDKVRELAGDVGGRKGQVMLADKLLMAGDRGLPELEQVLAVAPDAAEDLGKAYLTARVFKKVAGGEELVNPQQAANLWNQLGPRTKALLYTPEQIRDINDFLALAKRVMENPNPSNSGVLTAMLKAGAFVTHPFSTGTGFAFGRNIAKVLYTPQGAQALKTILTSPGSPGTGRAMLIVQSLLNQTASAAERPPAIPAAAQ